MHIVIVDPSRTVLKAVSHLLESDGHAISAFADGQEALDFIKTHAEVSALITSAELNSLSGLELCWETRLLAGRDRAIYIILMSSNSDQKQLINALDSGADELIGKPPAREELYARLRSADRMLRMQRDLIRLAMVDPLTGLLNRRAFFEEGNKICPPEAAAAAPVAVMFDVDHFKRVNDTYGHDVGDQVLRAIGQQASDSGTFVGRLGGEEFAILLKNSDLAAARDHAERLRIKLAALSFDTARGPMSITSSFGVAEWQIGESIDDLLKRADGALYQAKQGGRNRVATAERDSSVEAWSGLIRSDIRGSDDQRSKSVSQQTNTPTVQPSEMPASDMEDGISSSNDANIDPSRIESAVGNATANAYVLDDEPQIGALVCKVLQACGFTPRQFTAPPPFLDALKTSPPDLIVLDLALGQSDAIEVMRDLEQNKYRGRVLLISGRDEITLNEITQIGEKHGLAMLPPLKKPFRPADVRQRLQVALPGGLPNARGNMPRDNPASAKKTTLSIAAALK